MKTFSKYILAFSIASLLSPPVVAFSGNKIDGVVVDAGNKRPVPDVFVLVVWRGFVGITHGQNVCYHVESAKTDSLGHFQTKAWSTGFAMSDLLVSDRKITTTAFKPGYLPSMEVYPKNWKIHLAPFQGTSADYFEYMNNTMGKDSICLQSRDDAGQIYPLFASLVADASSRSQTDEDRRITGIFEIARKGALKKLKVPTNPPIAPR